MEKSKWFEFQRFMVDFIVSYLFAVMFVIPVVNVFFLRSVIGVRNDFDNAKQNILNKKKKEKKVISKNAKRGKKMAPRSTGDARPRYVQ